MSFSAFDLTNIEAAIASGELIVEIGNRRVQYRSIEQLLQARALIKEALARTGSSASIRSTLATFKKD
jgi:hypothetical protein